MLINTDIAISGLGWIGVSGKGNAKFILHIPPQVTYNLWEPLAKFEIWAKGLEKRPIITVNSFTHRNKKLTEKFKFRRSQVE